jgi:hypothetical protein
MSTYQKLHLRQTRSLIPLGSGSFGSGMITGFILPAK